MHASAESVFLEAGESTEDTSTEDRHPSRLQRGRLEPGHSINIECRHTKRVTSTARTHRGQLSRGQATSPFAMTTTEFWILCQHRATAGQIDQSELSVRRTGVDVSCHVAHKNDNDQTKVPHTEDRRPNRIESNEAKCGRSHTVRLRGAVAQYRGWHARPHKQAEFRC